MIWNICTAIYLMAVLVCLNVYAAITFNAWLWIALPLSVGTFIRWCIEGYQDIRSYRRGK